MVKHENRYTFMNIGIVSRSIACITIPLLPFVFMLWFLIHFEYKDNYIDISILYYCVGFSILICTFGIIGLFKIVIVFYLVNGIYKYVLDDSGITVFRLCRNSEFYNWIEVVSVIVDQGRHVGRSTIKIKLVDGKEILVSGYFLTNRWNDLIEILQRNIPAKRFNFKGKTINDKQFYETIE